MEGETALDKVMRDVNAKTAAVAAARKALDAAKTALKEAQKAFDREVRSAAK